MCPPRTVQVYFSREWEWVILPSESTLEGRVDTDGSQDLPSVCAPMMAAVSLPLKPNWSRKKSSVASPLPCRYRYY